MGAEWILDAGPIIAALDESEKQHEICCEMFRMSKKSSHPLVTSEAVVTEATHLLGRLPRGVSTCVDFIMDSQIHIMSTSFETLKRVSALIKKYEDIPMDYADATLVVLAEELETNQILTLDRRGFSAYRLHSRTPFHIIPN